MYINILNKIKQFAIIYQTKENIFSYIVQKTKHQIFLKKKTHFFRQVLSITFHFLLKQMYPNFVIKLVIFFKKISILHQKLHF